MEKNPLLQMGSGTPFDLTANGDSTGVVVRPDIVGIAQPYLRKNFSTPAAGFNYLNVSAFRDAPKNAAGLYTRVGTVHRNEFYGPGYDNTGLSIIA